MTPTDPSAEEGHRAAPSRWIRSLVLLGGGMLIVAAAVLYAASDSLGPHVDGDLSLLQVEQALTIYAAKHRGQSPERLEEAARYFRDGEVPTDPWGTPFVYQRLPDDQGARGYVLISLGADRLPGDQGGGPDLVRWWFGVEPAPEEASNPP